MQPPAQPSARSSLTPLEAHLREQLLALIGLTPAHLTRMQTLAASAGVRELRLLNAAGAWLELLTDAPLASDVAVALADALTAAIQRPVDVRPVRALPAGEREGAWTRAVPLWP